MNRLRLILLAMVFLMPSFASAGIEANLEYPRDGEALFGVGSPRGWAFETAGGAMDIRLIFPKVGFEMELACCTSRPDVYEAYGKTPAAKKTGFAGTINWGNFPEGWHEVRWVVNGVVLKTFQIYTGKVGGMDFVKKISLQSAKVENGEVVITTSVEGRSATLYLRWHGPAQQFMIDESVSGDQALKDTSWPKEVATILQALPVPEGLTLYWSPTPFGYIGQGCPGGYSPANYNYLGPRVEIYQGWQECFGGTQVELVYWTAHEACHAHQHRMILDARIPVTGLEPWVGTPEGKAFMAAGGKISFPWNGSVSPVEDFANLCASWFLRRTDLQKHDPTMYKFAKEWLPNIPAVMDIRFGLPPS